MAKELPARAGLPDAPGHLRDQPLAWQRRLVAAHRVLTGDVRAAAWAGRLNPSDRALWDDLAAKRRSPAAAAAAARDRAVSEAARKVAQAADLTPEDIDAILDRTALPAIHLRRVWPMGREHRGQSWPGGRPCLPDKSTGRTSPSGGCRCISSRGSTARNCRRLRPCFAKGG
ncbi:MAG: hypothetical protein ACK4GO_02745 [Gemmobacter sp.]